MQSASRVRLALGAVVLAGAVSGIVFAGECAKKEGKQKEVKVDWKDVPAAVQATVQTNLNGATVVGVEKEIEDGKTVYEAKARGADGKVKEIAVADDGKLIKVEADDDEEAGAGKGKEEDKDE